MSMTGSENEEETTRTPEKLTEEASKAKQDVTVSLKPCSVDLKRCYSPTCMLGLLRRPELLPAVLEFEKTMLVIKEHSYARAPDRPEVLQLSNIHAIDLSSQDEDANTLLNARTDLLQLRESIGNERSEPSVVGHLRQVVGLQVALIRDQQEQLYEKDRDMNAVKKEKEQLEARLERMERRLSILQKHSRLKQGDASNADSPLTSPTNPAAPNSLTTPIRAHLTRRESIIATEFGGGQSRSSSVEPGGSRSRSRPSSRAGSPCNDSSAKRSHKRKLKETDKDEKSPRKRTKHLRELRTDFEYQGLELSVPKQRNGSQSEHSPVPNHTDPETPMSECDVSLNERELVNAQPIQTPSWRSCTVAETMPETSADCEDLSDDLFNRRHKKPEEEEKRRKRWDMQRARTLREHNDLLRKYNMKSGEKGTDKKEKPLATFIPHFSEVDTIEVMDTVTVSAFGRPLPVIKPSEFELPWFDIDVREAKETVRTTRSRTKTHRASVGGSADEL